MIVNLYCYFRLLTLLSIYGLTFKIYILLLSEPCPYTLILIIGMAVQINAALIALKI